MRGTLPSSECYECARVREKPALLSSGVHLAGPGCNNHVSPSGLKSAARFCNWNHLEPFPSILAMVSERAGTSNPGDPSQLRMLRVCARTGEARATFFGGSFGGARVQ